MNDGWVKSINEERDFGMLMSKDLKFSKQCQLAKYRILYNNIQYNK